ncbi:MAG: hypothetical protein KAZ14_00570 [Nitrosomonas sp.]|nr:hypothetical protein [Nitrosomonas sp.]
MSFSKTIINYIAKDVTSYYDSFNNGVEPEVEVGDDYIVIKNYPLRSKFKSRTIALMLILDGFPEKAPAGIYIPTHHPDVEALKKIFWTTEGKPSFAPRVEALGAMGWTWLCNGFRALAGHDGKWLYAETTKTGNDSLTALLAMFATRLK